MRIAQLASGGGTTAQQIRHACMPGGVLHGLAEVVLHISSDPVASSTQKALADKMDPQDVMIIERSAFATRGEFGIKLREECLDRGVDLIGQWGWLQLTPENVVSTYEGWIINQHPGPLDHPRPDFGGKGMYGLRVHHAVVEFSRRIDRPFTHTEVTAHHVTTRYDEGQIIAVSQVPIEPGDTAETLRDRALPYEHAMHIDIVRRFAIDDIPAFTRKTPLVHDYEIDDWQMAREEAMMRYPHG